MTPLESANLVEIMDAMGIKDKVGDFILGLGGAITPKEAAGRLLEALERKEGQIIE